MTQSGALLVVAGIVAACADNTPTAGQTTEFAGGGEAYRKTHWVPTPTGFVWGDELHVEHRHASEREWYFEPQLMVPYAGIDVTWWGYGYCHDRLCAMRGLFTPSMEGHDVKARVVSWMGRDTEHDSGPDGLLRFFGWHRGGEGIGVLVVPEADYGSIDIWVDDVPHSSHGLIRDCWPLWSKIDRSGVVRPHYECVESVVHPHAAGQTR